MPIGEALNLITEYIDSSITSSDAKGFLIDRFYTSNKAFHLYLRRMDYVTAFLMYVDKNVTINGQYTKGSITHKYQNVSLKKGWNSIIQTENGSTYTYTVSNTSILSDGFEWMLGK